MNDSTEEEKLSKFYLLSEDEKVKLWLEIAGRVKKDLQSLDMMRHWTNGYLCYITETSVYTAWNLLGKAIRLIKNKFNQ